ncbi:RING finger and transmembrane domain-containing protein 2 [Malaya genurostris]|uniref:RING finger and transmembrane domain-containing protein 2 n=1 Tax=Malaya genurostris TaxID=325434 RepID=UPI0026F3D359|nr:RING finger and transmembrane domain-containing protein 2 [Malaya genurostris]XP_058456085.1 RING finger and transmembrane domain-containing protein 2 [Malaya genurostris]
MSDNSSETQKHSSSSTASSAQSPVDPVAKLETSASSTTATSPAIIETTTTTLTVDEGGRPPLASEEDTSSTISIIASVTVTAITENSAHTSSSPCLGSQSSSESTVLATVHQPSIPILVERQISVTSNDGSMQNSNASNGFRTTFNGRVPFARILSTGTGTDRRVNGNETGRVAGNLSNNLLNDIFAFVQQARNPNSLFSSERRNLFLQSGRTVSQMSGGNTPPIVLPVGNPTDVVIDVDNVTGPSLRSSNNEIFPISTSSSIASGIRQNSWTQPNSGDEDGSNMGRSSIVPNFNYHHHHHHFHNHQPLSTVHHHLPHLTQQQQQQLQQVQTGQQSQPVSLGASGSGNGIPVDNLQLQPTTPTNPNPNNGTRSNSVSSNNQPADEATVHEALNQIPEARAMMDTFARYIPLLFILIIKLCYDHLDGIIHFLALLMTFSHANWVVRQEISKQAQKRIMVLLRELIFIVVALAVVGFLLERKNIFLSIMFMPDLSEPQNLKSLLFSVCMSDLVLKLLTIIAKILITVMPPSVIEYKSRGKIYLMTESLSQLYRAAAPIQPWLIFLFESYSGSEKIVGVILSAVYMVAKSSDLLDRIKFCKRSVIKLLQKTSYGTIPSKEQLQACGGQCPICHDNFNSPVLLECNHIFCELCVGTWFDREQTCPLCRAKIVDDPSYRDGATTFFLQLY